MNDYLKIEEVQRLAKKIDSSINLFEGYSAKSEKGKKNEILFWRKIMNMYSVFNDCDRVLLKNNDNLWDLLKKYSLITEEDYQLIHSLWEDVSTLRGWFCHNNNTDLYYSSQREDKLNNYIQKVFALQSKKPSCIEKVDDEGWKLMVYDIQIRFEQYMDVLLQALQEWVKSEKREEIISEWKIIYAKALFNDIELKSNVLAEKAQYYCVERKMKKKYMGMVKKRFEEQLLKEKYDICYIQDELAHLGSQNKSAFRIIFDSMNYITFEL